MKNSISKIKKKAQARNRATITILAALLLLVAAALTWNHFHVSKPAIKEKPISQMSLDVDANLVKSIEIAPDYLLPHYEVELKDGEKYSVSGPRMDVRDTHDLAMKGVIAHYLSAPTDWTALPNYLVIVLMLGMMLLSSGQWVGFSGKSAAKSGVRFTDVAGNEEAKTAMLEIVDYLRQPDKYEEFGARFPKGVIMDGPPGTGKTLLAKAVAGEAGANFIAVSGSDFQSMFVSVSGMKVRSMFAKARRMAPCVLFIDEIDAVGGHRLNEGSAAAREMGSTLNSLLVQMDGFVPNSGVVVIAATNRIELLDPALLRSGRFDRHIHVQLPTLAERDQILRLHGRTVKIGEFNYSAVARACIGMSGADLANVINQAALLAVREQSPEVLTRHGLGARDRVVMGDPRHEQARSMSQETRRLLAVHEAGHAVVGLMRGPDKVSRISIIPRGRSLGQTILDPSEDNLVKEATFLIGSIRLLLGGRAAEIAVANTQTTGASDDLQRASRLALDLVGRYGMSDISLLVVDEKSSDLIRREMEKKANEILEKCMAEATSIIQLFRPIFDEMVVELLNHEEIDEEGVSAFSKRLLTLASVPSDSNQS